MESSTAHCGHTNIERWFPELHWQAGGEITEARLNLSVTRPGLARVDARGRRRSFARLASRDQLRAPSFTRPSTRSGALHDGP
eukprot:6234649-Pyramimonas_sp.AAC.1